MLNVIAFLVAVSPCFVILAALIPGRWLEQIPARRWRSFCGHFVFLAGGFLALAFWFFHLDAPWQMTAVAVALAAMSAAFCLLSASALAVRSIFSSQSAECKNWEDGGRSGCDGNHFTTIDPL